MAHPPKMSADGIYSKHLAYHKACPFRSPRGPGIKKGSFGQVDIGFLWREKNNRKKRTFDG